MLEAYAVSQSLIRALAQLVRVIKKFDRDLADQLQRAGSSCLLNVGEGQRRSGGDRGRFFGYARGRRAKWWPCSMRRARGAGRSTIERPGLMPIGCSGCCTA